jgi:hypothetical protein
MTGQNTAALEALLRLFAVAGRDTGQARRVADFLLAWYNAKENGGWDPTDLWNVDDTIADDLLTVLHLLREQRCYVEDLGFEDERKAVWQHCRGERG